MRLSHYQRAVLEFLQNGGAMSLTNGWLWTGTRPATGFALVELGYIEKDTKRDRRLGTVWYRLTDAGHAALLAK